MAEFIIRQKNIFGGLALWKVLQFFLPIEERNLCSSYGAKME